MFAAIVFLTAAVHFAFVIYLVLGGFIAVRWRRTIWLHLLAALWGLGSVGLHLDCPLTWLEQNSRVRAGMPALPSTGFIAHYITGVLYPEAWATGVEVSVAVLVVASWWMFLAPTAGRRSSRRRLVRSRAATRNGQNAPRHVSGQQPTVSPQDSR